jgi:hypothetical protein
VLEFGWQDGLYKWRPYIKIRCYKFRGTVCRHFASCCESSPDDVPSLWQGPSINVLHVNEFHSGLRWIFWLHYPLLRYYIVLQRVETWRSSLSWITFWNLEGAGALKWTNNSSGLLCKFMCQLCCSYYWPLQHRTLLYLHLVSKKLPSFCSSRIQNGIWICNPLWRRRWLYILSLSGIVVFSSVILNATKQVGPSVYF